jgi:hypothetical protein
LVALVVAAILVGLGVQLSVGWQRAWAWVSAPLRLPVGAPDMYHPGPDVNERPLVSLAVAGDVGTGEAEEWATAAAMDRSEAASGEFGALLLLGDNIYPDGDVARLKSAVLDPFAAVLDGGTALLAALGNHDVRIGDGEPQRVALGMPGRWYSTRLGPVDLFVLDSTRVEDSEQLAWLDRTLAASTAPWKIVAQHHPPYSAGYHGSHEPSQYLLVPLFSRHGVDLVLAGHDHDYQRSAPQEGGVVYVVSGGAATLRQTGRAEFTAAAASTYHFVELAVFVDRLELRAVDQQGRVFDQAVQELDTP